VPGRTSTSGARPRPPRACARSPGDLALTPQPCRTSASNSALSAAPQAQR